MVGMPEVEVVGHKYNTSLRCFFHMQSLCTMIYAKTYNNDPRVTIGNSLAHVLISRRVGRGASMLP